MTTRILMRWAGAALALVLVLFLPADPTLFAEGDSSRKKPALTVRATPVLNFVPAKVQFLAILDGGDDDYQEYYCPSVEWDWGDDTVSSSTPDCDPYEAGRSRITRRFSSTHVFLQDGQYEVRIKLKRGKDVLTLASVRVHVRPG
jgi:hypothetical protein